MENLDNNKISIRFILDRNHTFTHLFDKSTTFKQIEEYLFTNKPKELFLLDNNNDSNKVDNSNSNNSNNDSGNSNSNNNDKLITLNDKIKFLYSGKLFNEKETVGDLEKTQKQHPLNCQLVKVKNPNLKQETSQKNHQIQQSATESVNLEVHFHGCFFDYDEFKQIEEIFNRKQDSDERVIKLSFLNQFLHKYWSYLIQHQSNLVNDPSSNNNSSTNSNSTIFPTEKLSSILRNVLKASNINSETTITKEQFRIIFYLFTSNSESTKACPNGSYNIVKTMIKQYHPTIDEGSAFNQDEFDKLYEIVFSTQPSSILSNINQQQLTQDQQRQIPTLSCISIELLFYLYTASIIIMKEQKRRSLQNTNNQNKTTNTV